MERRLVSGRNFIKGMHHRAGHGCSVGCYFGETRTVISVELTVPNKFMAESLYFPAELAVAFTSKVGLESHGPTALSFFHP